MIQNILCDLDGVLADFLSLALERIERERDEPVPPLTPESYHHLGNFDIAEVYGISAGEFWMTIEKGDKFWCNLKPFPWAAQLLAYLQSIAPVTICTSPSLHPICASQKVEWCMRHLGLKSSDMMIGGRKHLMAKPGNVLIDDLPKNIDAFSKAGGHGILVPSNWNTHPLTFDEVRGRVAEFIFAET